MHQLITVHNVDTNEFFIAPEHSNFGLGDSWVPCSLRCYGDIDYYTYLEHYRMTGKEISFPIKKAWVIIDGDKYNHKFLYNIPGNLWGPNRNEAKIFYEEAYAKNVASKFQTPYYEVTLNKDFWITPFIVNKWRDE